MEIISLFSGGGLKDLGFQGGFEFLGQHYPPTGFKIIWACDFDKSAVEAYKHNIGNHIIEADITTVMPPKTKGLIGGPPCQDFSVAGKGEGEEGERGKLVWDYLKKVDTLQPDFFCFENVEGLVQKKHWHTFEALLTQFSNLGYKVYWKVLNSWHYGVAQTRPRVFIIGFSDHNIKFRWPEKEKYRPILRDVIGDLPEPYQVQDYRNIEKHQNGKGYRTTDEPSFALDTWATLGVRSQPPNHKKFDNEKCNPSWEHANRIANPDKPAPARTEKDRCDGLLDPGFKNHIQTESTTVKPNTFNQRNYKAEWDKPGKTVNTNRLDHAEIHPGPMNHDHDTDVSKYNMSDIIPNQDRYDSRKRSNTYKSNDYEMEWDKPSFTVRGVVAHIHPDDMNTEHGQQPRRFTVRECLRIQSVPDTYVFPNTISLSAQYRITGNGVPSILAWKLAMAIKDALEGGNAVESSIYAPQESMFGYSHT
jgi:DNA (cytosine-5)-methyltransferase 1